MNINSDLICAPHRIPNFFSCSLVRSALFAGHCFGTSLEFNGEGEREGEKENTHTHAHKTKSSSS